MGWNDKLMRCNLPVLITMTNGDIHKLMRVMRCTGVLVVPGFWSQSPHKATWYTAALFALNRQNTSEAREGKGDNMIDDRLLDR